MSGKNKLILATIIAIGLILRLWQIQEPARPVFDEAFFAVFAADYSAGRPHFDVHPPLGKMIYALPLAFSDEKFQNPEFVIIDDPQEGRFYKAVGNSFGDFPYLPLRLVSALFGTAIILAAFWLAKNLAGEKAGLWAAFLIAIESGFIEASRFIFLDGLMIFFGLAALAIFFKDAALRQAQGIKNWTGWLAGIFWGLAISVKLNAAVFLAPLIIWKLIKSLRVFSNHSHSEASAEESPRFFTAFKMTLLSRRLLIFFITGLATLFFFWIILNNLLVPPAQWLEHYRLFLPETISADFMPKVSAAADWLQPIILFAGGVFFMINFALNGYLAIGGTHPAASPWHDWLIGRGSISFGDSVFLINNFFQFLILATLIWLTIRLINKKIRPTEDRPAIILAGSYILGFLPFVLVHRPTFLYQYLPVFAFGLILAAIGIEKFLASLAPAKRKIAAAFLILASLVSFAFTMPFIYS